MEVLFHLIFELVKIAILGSIYATVALIIFRALARHKPQSWFYRFSKKTTRCWVLCGVFISVSLFMFMFSYWGNHGLGDYACIPIGHFRKVQQINGEQTFIRGKDNTDAGIDHFIYDNRRLYASTSNDENTEGAYLVWELTSNEIISYATKENYLAAAQANNYPLPEAFHDFWHYYNKYWNGWRFWLLP